MVFSKKLEILLNLKNDVSKSALNQGGIYEGGGYLERTQRYIKYVESLMP